MILEGERGRMREWERIDQVTRALHPCQLPQANYFYSDTKNPAIAGWDRKLSGCIY
jgi:hypothetical protein